MNNKMTQITFDELYAHQERLCQQSLAQLIRLNQWKEDGLIYDEPDQEMLVGEILALDQQIRLEKEKDRRRREMDASRKKNK